MVDQVGFVGVDWGPGWLHFTINPNNTVSPTGYAVKVDQALSNRVNLSTAAWPPGFGPALQNDLTNLLAQLSAEWSKEAIDAAQVTLVDQVFWETGYEPAEEPAA